MIPLYDLLKLQYPQLDFSISNCKIIISGDGESEWISKWDYIDPPMPTQEEIQVYRDNPVLQHNYQMQLNEIANQPIIAQLEALDLKSIRALRSGDETYIQQFEQQAQQLRAQLLPTS